MKEVDQDTLKVSDAKLFQHPKMAEQANHAVSDHAECDLCIADRQNEHKSSDLQTSMQCYSGIFYLFCGILWHCHLTLSALHHFFRSRVKFNPSFIITVLNSRFTSQMVEAFYALRNISKATIRSRLNSSFALPAH